MKVVLKNLDDVETDPPPIPEGDSTKPSSQEEKEKSLEGKELQKKPKSVLRKSYQSPVLTTSDSIHDENPMRQQPPGRDCCVIL